MTNPFAAFGAFRFRPRPSLLSRAAACALTLLVAGCVSDWRPASEPAAQSAPPVIAAAADPANAAADAAEREHRQLVATFGGEYRAPAAQAYLTAMIGRLVAATRRPQDGYRLTILDSPLVNAFALPSGRIYVTRGLLALANDSSEVAAVLAHEIAHVTLRHAAERSELEMRSALVSRVVADVLRNPRAGAAVRDASRMDIARFSRQQEFEADEEGVRTLAAAGYDPFGASRFLSALDRWTKLEAGPDAQSVGQGGFNMLATHPGTADRIEQTRLAARRIAAPGIGAGDREAWLAALDGVTFGANAQEGIVRGRAYVHGRLRIGFTAPAGFRLDTNARAVLGSSANGARRLLFDLVEAEPGQSLADVLMTTWTDAITTDSLASLTVNGLEAATAASRGAEWNFRLAALRMDGRVYRLILAFRPQDAAAERLFRETLESVRRVTAADLADLRPPRLRVVVAGAGDTASRLAARMGDRPDALATFRILNGLADGEETLVAGRRYKLVGE